MVKMPSSLNIQGDVMLASYETMQAALLMGHGGPENLKLTARQPVPQPGSGEVLIRVGAAGMNNTDIWTREGAYAAADQMPSGWRGAPLQFPRIQGGDVAGRIVEAGQGVSRARVGERVLVNAQLYAKEGDPLMDAGLLGSERDGGFAEYVTVPAENAFRVDCDLTDAELATFPIASLTALHMLNRARVNAEDTVLVTGASGGVGSALVQLAAIRGAKVIAITGQEKKDYVSRLGAACILTRTSTQMETELRSLAPVDVVADVVGGPMFPYLIDSLAKGGRYVTAGGIAGPEVKLDLRKVYLCHLELIGSTMGTMDEFAHLVELINAGKLKPQLAGVFPLSNIRKAQGYFDLKKFMGNLVLVPDALYQHKEKGLNNEHVFSQPMF